MYIVDTAVLEPPDADAGQRKKTGFEGFGKESEMMMVVVGVDGIGVEQGWMGLT